MSELTVYQAGPLFSQAEKEWHGKLTKALVSSGHKVIWPGNLLKDDEIKNAGREAPKLIHDSCLAALLRCSIVVALLDGTQVDDGTAWEIGYACAKGIPVYGIRTDGRLAGETVYSTVNSMISASLQGMAFSIEELLHILANFPKIKKH